MLRGLVKPPTTSWACHPLATIGREYVGVRIFEHIGVP